MGHGPVVKLIEALPVLQLVLVCGGCAGGSDSSSPTSAAATETAHNLFDGFDVEEQLEEDPDVTFFIDLREPQTYSFDQRQVDIDFSRFLVQSPSMDSPMRMENFAQGLGISLEEDVLTLWNSEFDARYDSTHRCGGCAMCDDPGDPCANEGEDDSALREVVCGDPGDDCVTLIRGLPFTP